jgi:hypothetical protein
VHSTLKLVDPLPQSVSRSIQVHGARSRAVDQ